MLPPCNFYWFRIDNKHMVEPWLDQMLMDSAYRSDSLDQLLKCLGFRLYTPFHFSFTVPLIMNIGYFTCLVLAIIQIKIYFTWFMKIYFTWFMKTTMWIVHENLYKDIRMSKVAFGWIALMDDIVPDWMTFA